jgi:hypothetical protein
MVAADRQFHHKCLSLKLLSLNGRGIQRRGRALSGDIDINISAVFMSRKIPGVNSSEE